MTQIMRKANIPKEAAAKIITTSSEIIIIMVDPPERETRVKRVRLDWPAVMLLMLCYNTDLATTTTTAVVVHHYHQHHRVWGDPVTEEAWTATSSSATVSTTASTTSEMMEVRVVEDTRRGEAARGSSSPQLRDLCSPVTVIISTPRLATATISSTTLVHDLGSCSSAALVTW